MSDIIEETLKLYFEGYSYIAAIEKAKEIYKKSCLNLEVKDN